jgi:hypothetical protein
MDYDDFMRVFELEFNDNSELPEELLNLDKELMLKTKKLGFLYPAS